MNRNLPKPTGEYAVGTFTYTVKDDREEALKPPAMRSVAARVYYPVLKSSMEGCNKSAHMSRNMAAALKRSFMFTPGYDKLEAAGMNTSECFENAPFIEGEKFPLIMFSHGYMSFREGNSFLCIELASHGYVVISVAHSLEGVCTELDDGTCLFSVKGLAKKMYRPYLGGMIGAVKLSLAKGTNAELAEKFDVFQNRYCGFMMGRLEEWVKDMKAALEYAKRNLGQLIDFDNGIGAAGHSFGGDTAYALCLREKEFACGVNIDGALFGDYCGGVLEKPFMQISCKGNEKIVTGVYLKHTKMVYKVLFRAMAHIGFSDMKHMMGFGVGKLDPDAMHENLCRCHLEMFEAYLKKTKARPELKSNDTVTVTEFEPDM